MRATDTTSGTYPDTYPRRIKSVTPHFDNLGSGNLVETLFFSSLLVNAIRDDGTDVGARANSQQLRRITLYYRIKQSRTGKSQPLNNLAVR